jgi:polar amino acid transport system ATP-binding protein
VLTGTNLCKSYDGLQVLNVDRVVVEPGKITTLIGPSGSGKTSLLRALALLDPPDSGAVTIDELTYRFPHIEETEPVPPWPRVTLVFQQLFLWPHLTLRQNITLPLRLRERREDGHLLDELIEQFEMGGFIDRYPNRTSLGQRQRAALARALVLQPRYILLDEITSSLDVEQIAVILNHLLALRGRGIGILLVTHLIGFARRAADHVVFLDRGAVLEADGPALLDSPRHERVRQFLSVAATAS